jgi:hypothetical protein
MNNLPINFHLFLDITKTVFKHQTNTDDNFKFYPRKPKLTDCDILALILTAESIGINSESYFFGKLRNDYADDFPNLIDRSNFNRRKKHCQLICNS